MPPGTGCHTPSQLWPGEHGEQRVRSAGPGHSPGRPCPTAVLSWGPDKAPASQTRGPQGDCTPPQGLLPTSSGPEPLVPDHHDRVPCAMGTPKQLARAGHMASSTLRLAWPRQPFGAALQTGGFPFAHPHGSVSPSRSLTCLLSEAPLSSTLTLAQRHSLPPNLLTWQCHTPA